jgi:2,3-bisphosphoglycerate-dependent phosphoglycerate mutase
MRHSAIVLRTGLFALFETKGSYSFDFDDMSGVVEAVEAGQVFRSHELTFRKCYASLLSRSIVTAHRSLEAAGISYTPIEYDWRLNERHYGALQGLSKERTAVRLGQERVMKWRRSYQSKPPLMTEEHPHYDTINNDPRYSHLNQVPLGESLEDCQKRVVDAWEGVCKEIASVDDTESPYSLVVAHANSLRALVMHLDNISPDEIEGLNIPTAIPFFYDICKSTGEVLFSSLDDAGKSDVIGKGSFRGIYISDERKKRSFLERRRAANDPWVWALHDHQVARSMLVGNSSERDGDFDEVGGLQGLEEEARKNTLLFSSAFKVGSQ